MRAGGSTTLEQIRPYVANELPPIAPSIVTGIIGDQPSRYAKTPSLWNAVYVGLGWDAVSLPWDLELDRLSDFVDAARRSEDLLGFSVTVPFKTSILPLLDELDPLARGVGAVNTVVRHDDGRLCGYNTDGQGAIDALTAELPGLPGPFFDTLRGLNVLIVGAGGAARAVAFFVADQVGDTGSLRIVNRTADRARELAAAVHRASGIGQGGDESEIPEWIEQADLVINASTKGQSGWLTGPDGGIFQLEPYSALAPANPWVLPAGHILDDRSSHEWFTKSVDDVDSNARSGRRAIVGMKPGGACLDLVYSPLETRFLAHARYSGHRTMNGKWMNIAQAADAFATKVCAGELRSRGIEPAAGYAEAFEIMASVW
jgi:shikimate dehydrogenase